MSPVGETFNVCSSCFKLSAYLCDLCDPDWLLAKQISVWVSLPLLHTSGSQLGSHLALPVLPAPLLIISIITPHVALLATPSREVHIAPSREVCITPLPAHVLTVPSMQVSLQGAHARAVESHIDLLHASIVEMASASG
ncbi:hypothetical protein B0H13DRAFT_2334710 [Mycena leptocephala]|nr:hypothetical protein B0H13DRAFT_2334710 [Mycena leptocephala]